MIFDRMVGMLPTMLRNGWSACWRIRKSLLAHVLSSIGIDPREGYRERRGLVDDDCFEEQVDFLERRGC